jgi:hypothetical protein
MSFDKKGFMQTKFERRTQAEPVPELKAWFDKDEKPVWRVQMLTGMELGIANVIAAKQNVEQGILEGILSGYSTQTKDAIKKLMFKDENLHPEDIAKRIEHLRFGSVDPVCDYDLALKLCKRFPIVFLRITNVISLISGIGALPGKSEPFGKTNGSK